MKIELNSIVQNQQDIEEIISRRIAEHQQEVAGSTQKVMGGAKPLIGIAMGDSWFDYPLPAPPTDVRDSLKDIGTPHPIILKLAYAGEATTALLGVTKRHRLISALKDPRNGPIDFIMFSGGGDDLIGDQFRFWLRGSDDAHGDPRGGVNHELLSDILGVVLAAYGDLANIRNSFAPHAMLLVHAYDFAVPDGRGVCGFGPWLQPSLFDRGWMKLDDGSDIVKQILLEFKTRLVAFCAAENAIFVPTQGTLKPTQEDWANELHPTPQGFVKIAEKFRDVLRHTFPGRI